jgi:hypothetical protein
MLIPIFNHLKGLWSRAADWIKRAEPRTPIPKFKTPTDVAAYIQAHGAYTGDPLNGAADFFLHPERLQAAMEAGPEAVARLPIDCDDWAAWSFAALRRIAGCKPVLYTLEDGSGKWGHHVVCGYTWRGGAGVIDTNGQRRLVTLSEEQLCATFTELYKPRGYTYVAANPTPYPFDH